MVRQSCALVLAVVTLLPIAAGAWRAALALRGPERHVCACPIDDDGNCQCPDCIRLEIRRGPGLPSRITELPSLTKSGDSSEPNVVSLGVD